MKPIFKVLLISSMVFSLSCGSEQKYEDKIDSLQDVIVDYQEQDKQKNDLILNFNQKLTEYGNLQDSIKLREDEIRILKEKIRRKGYASRSESKQLNKMLSEIDNFLVANKELATQFDSTNFKTATQSEIVTILLKNIKDKQTQINDLKNSVRQLKKQVKGLEIDNKNLEQQTAALSNKADSLQRRQHKMAEKLLKATQLTIYNHSVKLPLNVLKKPKKAKNISKIDICFTINKSSTVSRAVKTVYVRIIDPNRNLLYKSKDKLFKYDGKTIGYSLQKDIEYKPDLRKQHCVEWSCEKGSLHEGKYIVALYIDNYLLDEKYINLR